MNAQALSHFPMPWLTCVALVLFVAVFAGVTIRAFTATGSRHFGRTERLPLGDEGDDHE